MTSTDELTKTLLENNGCDYDDNVVHQLNEYAMRLMKNIIQHSSNLADLQKRSHITTDDIKQSFEYLQNPDMQFQEQMQIANEKNQQLINDTSKDQNTNYGIRLPANDSNKLAKPNFQVIIKTQADQPPFQQQMDIEKLPQKPQTVKPGRKKIVIEMEEEQ